MYHRGLAGLKVSHITEKDLKCSVLSIFALLGSVKSASNWLDIITLVLQSMDDVSCSVNLFLLST